MEKKDDKAIVKIKKDLAETTEKLVVDIEKQKVREDDAAAEEQEKEVAKAQIAAKKAKLDEFETEKKAADAKVTKEFAE